MVGNYKDISAYIKTCMFLLMVSGCKTSEVTFNKRVISNTQYKEQFYITDKEPKSKLKIFYHWYKSQKVHVTQSDYSGSLLDGSYTKYYNSNQLAEKGTLKQGRKVGTWKSWYPNGNIAITEKWNNGRRSGRQVILDSIANVISIGSYAKGKRSGRWIYPKTGDTIYYKKGEKHIKKVKDTSQIGFFERVFKKKDSVSSKKIIKKKPASKKDAEKKKSSKTKKTVKRTTKSAKPGFLQKLFSKKEKKK